MLDRLKAPDGAPELHAPLGVLDRLFEEDLGRADRLCCLQDGGHEPGNAVSTVEPSTGAGLGPASAPSSGTATPSKRTSAKRRVRSSPDERALAESRRRARHQEVDGPAIGSRSPRRARAPASCAPRARSETRRRGASRRPRAGRMHLDRSAVGLTRRRSGTKPRSPPLGPVRASAASPVPRSRSARLRRRRRWSGRKGRG